MRIISRSALLAAALAAQSAFCLAETSASNCSTAPDATCFGRPAARGVSPIAAAAPAVFAQEPNSCVSAPFVAWAYDPDSYKTPPPTFVAPAAGGYVGSGGRQAPTQPCPSGSDGSCSAWVPASHPYLLLGDSSFSQCDGARAQGSVACSVSGARAYVTANPAATHHFSASMIACKTNQPTPGMSVLGLPLSSWQSCASSPLCSFFWVYPPSAS